MKIKHNYNAKINIMRVTKTEGDYGDTESTETLHENVPCKFRWKTGNEEIVSGKVSKKRVAKVFCAVIDINQNDRIVYDSITYEILNIFKQIGINQWLQIDVGILD